MKRIVLGTILLSALLLVACAEQSTTEKYQKSRNNIVDVKDKVVEINTGDVLIGNNSRMSLLDKYWIVVEYGWHVTEEFIHIFDRDTYEPVLNTADIGQGPGEFPNPGRVITDEAHRCFYLPDYALMKLYTFYIDSLLVDPDWQAEYKCSFPEDQLPIDCVYVNDTLCIGRLLLPIGVNDFRTAVCRWNIQTGTIRLMPYEHPKIKKKRAECIVSLEHNLYVDVYNRDDLLTFCDLDGNLICNVYGPDWRDGEWTHRRDQFRDAVICGDKLVACYSGKDRRDEYSGYATILHVFDLQGNYIKTLDVGYLTYSLCYDAKNNRLLLGMDDEIQFGYLPLEGLL